MAKKPHTEVALHSSAAEYLTYVLRKQALGFWFVAFGHCFHLHHEYQNDLHRPQGNGARAGGLFGNNRRIPAHPALCLPRRYFPRFSPQPNTQALVIVKWFEHGKRAGKVPLLPTNIRQARTVCPVMI